MSVMEICQGDSLVHELTITGVPAGVTPTAKWRLCLRGDVAVAKETAGSMSQDGENWIATFHLTPADTAALTPAVYTAFAHVYAGADRGTPDRRDVRVVASPAG